MSAVLDEQTQYVDSAGAPLVAGKIYIGTQNADPVANPITIFSDRDLTIAITNPQTLDADGRATNKIWIPGRYSLRIDDVNDVQQFQELDNGEEAASGITSLTNVSGADTITATAVTTIAAYTDKELYTFRTAGANTGAVTLNIDGVGAKSIVKNQDQAILPVEFEAAQNVVVSFNSANDNFEWVNHNNKVVSLTKGADIASATSMALGNDGNYFDVTGTTTIATITGEAGREVTLQFDAASPLIDSATLDLGGTNITVAAGDRGQFFMLTDSLAQLLSYTREGVLPLQYATGAQMEAAGAGDAAVSPVFMKFHPGVAKCWGYVTYSAGVPTLVVNHNITSIADDGVGDLGVTVNLDFSTANYCVTANAGFATDGINVDEDTDDRAAGTFSLLVDDTGGGAIDPVSLSFAAFGDH